MGQGPRQTTHRRRILSLPGARCRLHARKAKGHRGKLLVSVQLVPDDLVPHLPAGRGRSDPNTNPTLPKPVGRLQFTLNPFKMLRQLIGPAWCWKLKKLCYMLFCIVVTALLIYYMFPVVFGNILTAPFIGG